MKRIYVVLVLLLSSILTAFGNPSHIPVTRLVSPDNSKPMSYEEWKNDIVFNQSVNIGKVGERRMDGNKFNVIVNASLYPKLTSFLDPQTGSYISDLVNAGYSVSVDTMSMSSDPFAPETLRNFLIQEYNTGSAGAVLIGDLPIAWFQMMEVFWGLAPSYTDFPIDLFYMDIDGVWSDHYKKSGDSLIAGTDSIYDTHAGNMAPEIFVGRLTASSVGNDSALIYDYLMRDHLFRVDSLKLSKEALFYIDDDWASYSGQWSGDLGAVYDSILVVDNPETTVANDYRTRIVVSHEWVSLFAHSWPQGHGFKYNGGSSWSWFYSSEIPTLNPIANFYNLFACSNARYTDSQYSAGMYTFRNSYGLGALGSTKTGSMLEFQYFYDPLSQGYCLGDAFKDWFATMGEAWADTSRSWFYGMTLIGDPTFILKDSLTSIAEEDNSKKIFHVTVSPNPAHHYINFISREKISGSCELLIFAVDGRKVYSSERKGVTTFKWNCNEFPSGIYFYEIRAKHINSKGKLLIVK